MHASFAHSKEFVCLASSDSWGCMQVAGGQRYEKIRTYNAKDGRVSDHRLERPKAFQYKQLVQEGRLQQLHRLLLLQQAKDSLLQQIKAAEEAQAAAALHL